MAVNKITNKSVVNKELVNWLNKSKAKYLVIDRR